MKRFLGKIFLGAALLLSTNYFIFAQSGYGNSDYGNSDYGNSDYGNSDYGNSDYGNSDYEYDAYKTYTNISEHDDYGTYLTDLEGLTLYTFSNDKPNEGTSACSGGCTAAWPPYIVEEGSIATDDNFKGELSFIARADGSTQLAYNGWPLYYYVGDTKAGDTTGHEVSGVWFVASYGENKMTGDNNVANTYVSTSEHDNYGRYLTDLEGLTLYTFSNDKPNEGTSACSGGCTAAWPPYIVEEGGIVTDDNFNNGELSFITRTDGSAQLAYNGWPLYYYVGDTKAGDTTGHEVSGVWFVAAY